MNRSLHFRPFRPFRPFLAPLCGLALLLSAGLPAAAASEGKLIQQIRDVGLNPDDMVLPTQLTPEMVTWVNETVSSKGTVEKRLRSLLHALLDPDEGLGLQYEGNFTGTAAQVFQSRKANCLGFTQLYVALAREIGLNVYFLQVRDLHSYYQEGDLVISSGHVTVGTGPERYRLILEFTEIEGIDYRYMNQLSDLTALALFYSNRGAELLRQGQVADALPWLEKAVVLDPDLADGWINLGVGRRRTENLTGAEIAYRRALEADPQASAAYQNLAALYHRRGFTNEAQELLQIASRRENRNPFTYIELGDISMRLKDLESAERFYRRALWLNDDVAETHAALGWWASVAGEERLAKKLLRRAERIDPDNPRVARLDQRLSGKDLGLNPDPEAASNLGAGVQMAAVQAAPATQAVAQPASYTKKALLPLRPAPPEN